MATCQYFLFLIIKISDVNFADTHYFILIVPICLILMGSLLLICHYFFKAPTYLFWLGLGYIVPSFALAAQSFMSNQQLTLDFLHKSFFNQFNCLSFTQSKLYMPASKLNRRFNLLRRFLYTQDKILKHFILPNTCST